MPAVTITIGWEELGTVLSGLGVDAATIATIADTTELVSLARVSPGAIPARCLQPPASGAGIVVAERISKTARAILDEAGWDWFDRSGYISLTIPGLMIRSEVPSVLPPEPQSKMVNLAAAGPLTVALALLNEPDRQWGVRELASEIDLSPATVSRVLNSMRLAGYVLPTNQPLNPELFWKVFEFWQPKTWLLQASIEEVLEVGDDLNFGDSEGTGTGWAESDTFPAMSYGFGIRAGQSYPRMVYLPREEMIHPLRARLKEPSNIMVAQTVIAVAQTPWVTNNRRAGHLMGWAAPVVVALDLASDGRGRKAMMELFKPRSADIVRVW